MNVEQIYRLHRDEAFAKQFTAAEYMTFVAMPFGNTDKYCADEVYRLLKEQVYSRANELRAAAHVTRTCARRMTPQLVQTQPNGMTRTTLVSSKLQMTMHPLVEEPNALLAFLQHPTFRGEL